MTSMIITISPSKFNVDESVSSLMFGQRTMKVQNKPIVNVIIDYQALSIKLQDNYDILNDESLKIKMQYEKLKEEAGVFIGEHIGDMKDRLLQNQEGT